MGVAARAVGEARPVLRGDGRAAVGRRVEELGDRQGLLLILATLVAAGALVAPAAAAPTPVAVTLTDTGVTVSRENAVAGTVVFSVVNRGRRPHAFSIGKRRTAVSLFFG